MARDEAYFNSLIPPRFGATPLAAIVVEVRGELYMGRPRPEPAGAS